MSAFTKSHVKNHILIRCLDVFLIHVFIACLIIAQSLLEYCLIAI